MEFGKKLKALLKRRGLSQEQLGATMGVDQQQVSKWIRENKPPHNPTQLLIMARAVTTTVDYLIDETQTEPPTAMVAVPKGKLSPEECKMVLVVATRHNFDTAMDRLVRPQSTGGPSTPSEDRGPD